jgi:hypothetical protein
MYIRWWRIFNPIETINNEKQTHKSCIVFVWTIYVASHPNHRPPLPILMNCLYISISKWGFAIATRGWIIKEIAPTPSSYSCPLVGDWSFTHEELLQDYIAPWVGWDPNQGIVDSLIQMVIGCNLIFWRWYQNHKINQDQILKVSSMH